MDPSNFQEKLESFIQNLSIPREVDENIQNQVQETLYFLAQELGTSNSENLNATLGVFCRVLWNHLTLYLIRKYNEKNVAAIFSGNEQGFGLEEIQEVASNQDAHGYIAFIRFVNLVILSQIIIEPLVSLFFFFNRMAFRYSPFSSSFPLIT